MSNKLRLSFSSHAGLSEEAKSKRVGEFMPIALDLDGDGIPFSSNGALHQVDPSDPEQRKRMNEALLEAALRRGTCTASNLRTAPSWRSTANRCRCKGLRLRGRKLARTQRENPPFPTYYQSHSTLRSIYAGELAKTLVKQASHDDSFRRAA